MLGNKHRMPTHWRLLAVIWDDRRRNPRSDAVDSMELNILSLLSDGVISMADLDGFSEDLREKLAFVLRDRMD